jgi:4-amino-4-deoxy-L-arabinose transferase-like glycosyltransferase
VILPWYTAVYIKEGAPYLYENIIHQNFLRFFDAWSHKRPFYYYFTTLPLDFFPWSLFLPLGLYFSFRQINKDRGTRYFLIWFVWMFFFLSLSSGKISKYMLPVLPAVAFITSLAFREENHRYNRVTLFVLACFLMVSGIGLPFFKRDLYPEFNTLRLVFGGLCISWGIILFLVRTKRLAYAFAAIFSFLIVCYTIGNVWIYERWNHFKSPKEITETIKTHVKNCTPWIYYGSMRGVYVYYVGKKAIHVDEHDIEELARTGQNVSTFYILTKKRDMHEVTKTLGKVDVVFEEKVGTSPMVFLRFTH